MRRALVELEEEIVSAAKRLEARYDSEYQALLESDPEKAKTYYFTLWPSLMWQSETMSEPRVVKYVRQAGPQARKWAPMYFPYFSGLKSAYEIGVGPGFLFRLAQDYLGMEMWGCDLDAAEAPIFADMRRELGIEDRVQAHRIAPRQDIPIVSGSEAVFAFQTSFNIGFTVDDHRWFLDHCREKLSGPKKVFMLFNSMGFDDSPEIEAFYRSCAEFPCDDPDAPGPDGARDRNAFCILSLG